MKHSVAKKPENHLLRNALGSLKLLRSLRNQNEGNKIVEKHTKYLNIKKKDDFNRLTCGIVFSTFWGYLILLLPQNPVQ